MLVVGVSLVGMKIVVESGLNRFSSKELVVGRLHSVVGVSVNEPWVLNFVVLVVVVVDVPSSFLVDDLYFGFLENFLNLLK